MPEQFTTMITYVEPGGTEKKILIKTGAKVTRKHAELFMKKLSEQGRPYERLVDIRDVSEEYK